MLALQRAGMPDWLRRRVIEYAMDTGNEGRAQRPPPMPNRGGGFEHEQRMRNARESVIEDRLLRAQPNITQAALDRQVTAQANRDDRRRAEVRAQAKAQPKPKPQPKARLQERRGAREVVRRG